MTQPATDAKTVVLQYLEALRGKDLNGALAVLSPEAVYHIPGSTPVSGAWHGTDEIIGKFMVGLNERLAPDSEYTVEVGLVLADGDHVVVQCVTSSTARTGEPYVIDIAALFTVEDGRITVMREYFDTEYFARTLFGTD